MQTFLPYTSFELTAKCLDYRRLGKQRVETKQILAALAGETNAWKNHPAVKMWRGHEKCLVVYGYYICQEWINRGYKDTTLPKIGEYIYKFDVKTLSYPEWFNDNRLFASHRSNLLRKDKEYYSQFGWSEPDNLPYYWPTVEL